MPDERNRYTRQGPVAIFKICLSGQYGVGKTSIFKIVSKKTQEGAPGIDCFKYICADLDAEIALYDTAGREQYTSSLSISNYYRGAHVIVFVYDIKDFQSLRYVEQELKLIRDRGLCERSKLVLIRNKADVPSTRIEVSQQKQKEFLQNRTALFRNLVHVVEVSAIETPEAVTKLFYKDLVSILRGETPTGYVNVFDSFQEGSSKTKPSCC